MAMVRAMPLSNSTEPPPETADRDASRELTITKIPAGVTQLVFSYDASTLTSWDIALSKDLITWKNHF